MAQIVGEVLNVPAESVRVVARDTDITPYDMGTLGSRSLFHMGHAVKLAAEDARDQIAALRRELGEPEGSNTPVSGLFIKKYGMKAGNIVGSGSYKPEHVPPDHDTGASTAITPFWMVAATGAEIEIDTETGRLRIERLINAVDCGTLVNPRIVETQISGAAIMQLGFTLSEKINLDNGQITNAALSDYKICGISDLPGVMINDAVDAYQANAPFGAKGVGESSTMPLSPAIDDAIGVRLTELPLTAEAVFRALREKEGRPLEAA
jgi:CO/xanthine dehydrogenase Mo-binding subunit